MSSNRRGSTGSLALRTQGIWDDPPTFAIVQRGQISLGLDRSEGGEVPANQWWAAYLYIDDADAAHAEFAQLDLPEITQPEDRIYGCRDFHITDLDGHRLAFGQDLNPEPYGPGLGPDSKAEE